MRRKIKQRERKKGWEARKDNEERGRKVRTYTGLLIGG